MADTAFGARLREAREKAGLTQKEVCIAVGIPKPQTLSSYERAINNPPIEVLGALATLYQVSTDWLIFGKESSEMHEKSTTDYVTEFFDCINRLNLHIVEAAKNQRYYFALDLRNYRISGFNGLVSEIYTLQKAKPVLDNDDYRVLVNKRISGMANRSNGFERRKSPFGDDDDDDDDIDARDPFV